MKTVITLLVALFLALSMCSCDNSSNTEPLQNNETISDEELALKEAEATLAAVEQEMETYETLSLREKAENYLSWDKSYWKSVDEEISEFSDYEFSSSVEHFRYYLMDQCAIVLEENGETDMQFLKEIAHAYADCMILREEMINDVIEGTEQTIENFESLKTEVDTIFSSKADESDEIIVQELVTLFDSLFRLEYATRYAYYAAEVAFLK